MGLRVLVLAMELADPIFSGNGVYGRSLVDALLRGGASVFIFCAGPQRPPDALPELPKQLRAPGLRGVVQVRLSSWGRLDRHSDWQAWADGAAASAAARVRAFAPELVLAVDWTAAHAAQALLPAAGLRAAPPLVFACFRVFSRSEGISASDRAFYERAERRALGSSALTVAISSVDGRLLAQLAAGEQAPAPRIAVLNPPLRAEIAALANHTRGAVPSLPAAAASPLPDGPARTLLVYSGRLAPEKNVRAFTRAVALAAPALRSLGVRPALVGAGAGADGGYAAAARAELLSAWPDALVADFLPAAELARLLAAALLFVHPARYESFGMALLEAAALGVPLLLDGGGGVGACDLLPLGSHAFGADMGSEQALADRLAELVPALLHLEAEGARGDEAYGWASAAGAPPLALRPPRHPVARAARAAALGRSLDILAAELGALLDGVVARHAAEAAQRGSAAERSASCAAAAAPSGRNGEAAATAQECASQPLRLPLEVQPAARTAA